MVLKLFPLASCALFQRLDIFSILTLLSMQPTATEAEIKKAYYVKARQCHPDKKKDDELANEQFQELGEVRSSNLQGCWLWVKCMHSKSE